METRKNYVLDTSVLLCSPYSIYAFDDNNVFITTDTINEMEHMCMSTDTEERANAREFGLILDEVSKSGDLTDSSGVDLPSGGTLCVMQSNGHNIISVCKQIEESMWGMPILVTNKPYQRTMARINGVFAEEYKSDAVTPSESMYEGRCKLFVSSTEMKEFATTKCLVPKDGGYTAVRMDGTTVISDHYSLTTNEYIILTDSSDPKRTMLGRFDGTHIRPLLYYPGKSAGKVYGVEPLNVGQVFALDALLAPPSVAPLVILKGPAGTAKTFLTMAAALAQTVDNWGGSEGPHYKRILVTRPNTKMDDDIGFLKGTEIDKILPALRGVSDNIDNLSTDMIMQDCQQKDGAKIGTMVESLISLRKLDAQALAYMRGRSVKNQFICCDECQNATITQILSIVTRTGRDSKLVLCGDTDQIDHPKLDKRNNGVAFAAERMRGSWTCWQLTFNESECERSPLAAEAIARMRMKGSNI